MEEPVSSSESIPPLPSLLPPRDHGPKRADVLSLKLRLAGLLPPDDGQQYWAGLVEFMTGKINREELGIVIKRVLGTKGEAGQCRPSPLSRARALGRCRVERPSDADWVTVST